MHGPFSSQPGNYLCVLPELFICRVTPPIERDPVSLQGYSFRYEIGHMTVRVKRTGPEPIAEKMFKRFAGECEDCRLRTGTIFSGGHKIRRSRHPLPLHQKLHLRMISGFQPASSGLPSRSVQRLPNCSVLLSPRTFRSGRVGRLPTGYEYRSNLWNP